MERNGLIAQIWGGDLSLGNDQENSPLAGLLGSLMDVPVVTLVSDAEMLRPIAMMEETEVLHGASLGDVLAEEMGIEVAYGALVLIQPRDFAQSEDVTSKELGEVLGHIILEMTQGAFSVNGEGTDAAADVAHLAVGNMASNVKLSVVSGSRLQ